MAVSNEKNKLQHVGVFNQQVASLRVCAQWDLAEYFFNY
jgi:hypothetical protein